MPMSGRFDSTFTLAFNHDCSGLLAELAGTAMTEQDAADVLVGPLADGPVSVIDLCIGSAAVNKCRTRHDRPMTRDLLARSLAATPGMLDPGIDPGRFLSQGDVVEHYNARPRDLLDIVLAAGHARGLHVFGNVRLNHSCSPLWMEGVPGAPIADGMRRDFRHEAYREFLIELFEDLLGRDVDGVSLDFERKAPFFAEDAPQDERFAACRRFLKRVRALTDKPIVVRVAHDRAKGERQGQRPEHWMAEGLLDVVVPATHNHEPDALDWGFDRFLAARDRSPRPCKVWPQIWPTAAPWRQRAGRFHSDRRVQARIDDLKRRGADGAYLFNFHCLGNDRLRSFLARLGSQTKAAVP